MTSMTHYKRSWAKVIPIACGILLGAGVLSLCVLMILIPDFFSALRRDGLEFDVLGRWLFALFALIWLGAIWWLRQPRIAQGNGFPVNRAADPPRTHTLPQ